MATTSFEYFMGRENARLVRFLERNHSVSSFVQALIEHASGYALEVGCRPEDIEFCSPYISQDGHVHAFIRRKR